MSFGENVLIVLSNNVWSSTLTKFAKIVALEEITRIKSCRNWSGLTKVKPDPQVLCILLDPGQARYMAQLRPA